MSAMSDINLVCDPDHFGDWLLQRWEVYGEKAQKGGKNDRLHNGGYK